MLRYFLPKLSEDTDAELRALQAKVDSGTDRQEKYKSAKYLFGRKSPKKAFVEIRAILSLHSPYGEACYYCERDRYRDIEHIYPKVHFPEKCFSWENYVYACTICNQDAKRDKFAVFDENDNVLEFDRSLSFETPIPTGDPVIIDIRSENPLDYLQLDLQTGLFIPIGTSQKSISRALYTRDLFNLNNDSLRRIRKQAIESFKNYARQLALSIAENNSEKSLRIIDEMLSLPFPTVGIEMRRQSENYSELKELFSRLPEEIAALR